MAWKLIDANHLRLNELADFLEVDRTNRAVLSEHSGIECYKGNSLRNIVKSMEVLSKFPEQVVILHGMREIVEMQHRERSPLTRESFVDTSQTESPRDCRRLF